MIISETALSFLGLGLRRLRSAGASCCKHAQNVQTVAISPWLMLPAVPVIIVVMAFNFLGDGLRDAAIHINLGGGLRPLPTLVARLTACSSVPPPSIVAPAKPRSNRMAPAEPALEADQMTVPGQTLLSVRI